MATSGFTTFGTLQKAGVARPPSPAYAKTNAEVPSQEVNSSSTYQVKPNGQTTGMSTTVNGQPQAPYGAPPVQTMPTQQTFNGMPVQPVSKPPTTPNTQYQTIGAPQPISTNEFYPMPGAVPTPPQQGPGTTPVPQGVGNPGGAGPAQGGYQTPSAWQDLGNQLMQQYQQRQQQPAQQFQPGSNPFQGQLNQALNQSVLQSIQNPSAYTSDMALGTYNMLNQQLTQGYDYQAKKLQEMMARRGIDPSTIHGNAYSDLMTEQARAQANLAYQLSTDAAHQYQSDRASAQGMGLNYQGQQYGQDLGAFQANQSAQQQNFDQQQQALNNLLGFGQQEFNNQMTVNQFNSNQNDQLNQWLLAMLGGVG